MYELPVFGFILLLIFIASARFRIPPFIVLFGNAILFALVTGMQIGNAMGIVIGGMGRIFSLLGLPILGGMVIAKAMESSGSLGIVLRDISGLTGRRSEIPAIAGYVLAIPVMCCITAFLILHSFFGTSAGGGREEGNALYLLALGSILSFTFLYPSPVIIPLLRPDLGTDLLHYTIAALPLTFMLLLALVIHQRVQMTRRNPSLNSSVKPSGPDLSFRKRIAAWSPILVILLVVIGGILLWGPGASWIVQPAIFSGMLTALGIAEQGHRDGIFVEGAKRAGMITFDLCGAGALAAVVGASGTIPGFLDAISGVLPAAIVPMLLAAFIQTAQGSRVVTAAMSVELLVTTHLPEILGPVPLLLMICAGSCMLSCVTDPFFWVVRRITGDDVTVVLKKYTLPVAGFGLVAYVYAISLSLIM